MNQMNIRNEIKLYTEKAIYNLQKKAVFSKFKIPTIQILKPKESVNGDYALNIAMEIAKIEKENPIEVAKNIKEELERIKEIGKTFSRIEAINPGFINFYLSPEYLKKEIKKVLKDKEKFGNLSHGHNKKVQVEFISANPTGPLTVGNGRGGAFGDTLANVLQKAGYRIEKAYYINDYGNQIAVLGHSILKDADAKYSGEYIDKLSKNFKDETDAYLIGKKAAKIILNDNIKKTTDKLNIKYDEWFSESTLYQKGEVDKTIEYLKKKGHTYEKDGALWFKSSNFGDERDRVIIKSDGTKTYLAGDLAYHRYKFDVKKFDKVINIWGADHFGDVKGLMAGVEALGHKGKWENYLLGFISKILRKKWQRRGNSLEIVLLQFVSVLKDGKPVKMSKRLGTAIAMDDLLDELSADVTRFFFLQKSANTHLNFNMDLAKEQSDKNPVFYVQYAYARICSILRNGGIDCNKVNNIKNIHLLVHEKEIALMRQILRFKDVIEDTAIDYQVHRITQYALELSAAFHQFYNECHCLVDDKEIKESRLGLLLATKIALKSTLNVMGISAPEKM
ncbi:MAG: arginine--tRNA ligase [Candidatus Pacebacteria bacterium]|nr:arginine--tRNA ligase [Candidatus Paceibacterota bacterium]